MKRVALAALMSGFALYASAADQRQTSTAPDPRMPPGIPSDYRLQYTITEPPVEGIRLGKLSIRLGETLMREVADTIGTGKIQGQQAFVSWLCYRWGSGVSSTQLWLRNGTLSNTIGTVILKAEPAPIEANCSELPENFRQVSLLNGLKIGDSPAAIQLTNDRKSYMPKDSKDERIALVYRDVISGCGGGGVAVEGSLFIEWRRQAIYALIARKDPGSC